MCCLSDGDTSVRSGISVWNQGLQCAEFRHQGAQVTTNLAFKHVLIRFTGNKMFI